MNEVVTIGVDLAKNVLQVDGIDAAGAVTVRRQLRRGQVLRFFKKQPPCLVGKEACATILGMHANQEYNTSEIGMIVPGRMFPCGKKLTGTAMLN